MPSFADSAVIFILALMLFGPKKLPQLARQLGKLMSEFRRASNEFRMQMEDELRIEEQKEHQKKVDAMAGPPSDLPDPPHPHLPSTTAQTKSSLEIAGTDQDGIHDGTATSPDEAPAAASPIAESGSLRMMPPSTGLPTERTNTGSNSFDSHEPGQAAPHVGDELHNERAGNGHHIPEHSILPPAPTVGMSSEEPAAETSRAEEQTHA
ncbi:MAG: Sec-independent protein translocase subunit TatA/TatB [Janthinobacterium lividum]